jgi:hypothetical protein
MFPEPVQVADDPPRRLRAAPIQRVVVVAHRAHVVPIVTAPDQPIGIVGIGRA